MLVLTRKLDQEIVLDGNISIRVLQIKGNTVRLGINAPDHVKIKRGELDDRDSREAVNLPEADDLDANFTIVFDNQQHDGRDLFGSRAGNVAPCRCPSDAPSAQPSREEGIDHSSIEFRGKLPESFERNRLQEIAARMTRCS